SEWFGGVGAGGGAVEFIEFGANPHAALAVVNRGAPPRVEAYAVVLHAATTTVRHAIALVQRVGARLLADAFGRQDGVERFERCRAAVAIDEHQTLGLDPQVPGLCVVQLQLVGGHQRPSVATVVEPARGNTATARARGKCR